MGAQIGFTESEFDIFTKRLTKLQLEINGEMKSILKASNEIKYGWQGKAATDFNGRITSWNDTNMKEFNRIMDDFNRSLKEYKTRVINNDNESFKI